MRKVFFGILIIFIFFSFYQLIKPSIDTEELKEFTRHSPIEIAEGRLYEEEGSVAVDLRNNLGEEIKLILKRELEEGKDKTLYIKYPEKEKREIKDYTELRDVEIVLEKTEEASGGAENELAPETLSIEIRKETSLLLNFINSIEIAIRSVVD